MGTPDCDGSGLERETFSLHVKLSTQLSLPGSNVLLVNVSVASLGLAKEVPPSNMLHWPLKQDPAKDEVTNWRLESYGFPSVLSDSELYADSSYDSSVSEQSSISPCTSLAAYSDTRPEEFDRTDIWVSCLDLDVEDSALLPDYKERFLDVFSGSDFPSPSFRAVKSLQELCPSISGPVFWPFEEAQTPTQREEEGAGDSDDPIFWPFERTSYNSPEFDNFLSVSPRRNTLGITSVVKLAS